MQNLENKRQGLLIVDHGSRREESNRQLEAIAEMLRQQLRDRPVVAAHMELAQPSIAEGMAQLAGSGVNEVIVVPYLLAPGRHAEEDIPRLARAAAEEEKIAVQIGCCLGVDDTLVQLVLKRAASAGLTPL